MNTKNKIKGVIDFILYEHSVNEISLLRFLNIFFLSEWYSSLVRNQTITQLKWVRMSFGPSSNELIEYLHELKSYTIENMNTNLDGLGISLKKTSNENNINDLTFDDKVIISIAVRHTKNLSFSKQDQFIQNLFPLTKTNVNQMIDLISLSKIAP